MNGLKLTLAVVLIAVNAFFVIAEYALVRSRRPRLEAMRDRGERGAKLALRQVDHINEYISAVQIGVTMTSLGIGALGEPALAELLKGAFGAPLGNGVAVVVAVIVSFSLITFAQLVAGEMVPKFYAIDRAESLARRIARPLSAFRALLGPMVIGVTTVSNWLLKLIGVDMTRAPSAGTPEELKLLIEESFAGGQIDPGEAGMLTGVFHLHEQDARQVMTPIPAVVTVDISQDVEAALERCISTGHTRLLVTEQENKDRVRGVVHANGLMRLYLQDGPSTALDAAVNDVPIVPETKPLDDLLAELQHQRTQLAVVVDEYGRVVGIVTVEDIVEEVVGEIADETDPTGGEIRRLANGDWFVRGHVAVTDLADYGVQLPVDTDAYNSIGGLVFAQLGRLPRRGDTVSTDGYSIRVESVRENRIESVRVRERPKLRARDGAEE